MFWQFDNWAASKIDQVLDDPVSIDSVSEQLFTMCFRLQTGCHIRKSIGRR